MMFCYIQRVKISIKNTKKKKNSRKLHVTKEIRVNMEKHILN